MCREVEDQMEHILVVEDEKAIAKLLETALKLQGYHVDYALSGKIGADMLEKKPYDLVLLDIMLPEIDGYELFDYIKQFDTPVIFITAKSSLEDRVKGLHMGAYDYIVKPFEIAELLARVENVFRRRNKNQFIEYKNIRICIKSHEVYKDGIQIKLTQKEFELLLFLINNINIALSRELLYEKIWYRYDEIDSRTIDIHIRQLRRKLDLSQEIETVYRYGYRLKGRYDEVFN